jgi:DNA primase
MNTSRVTILLESVLGKSKPTSKENLAFYCPFCHHTKRKLEINLALQHWHCWVCNASGKKLTTLFRRLNIDKDKTSKLYELLEDGSLPTKQINQQINTTVRLPDEFKPLWITNDVSPEFRNAFAYLKRRGVTILDIIKYRIGYCETGLYSGKIIIPSFDKDGQLNYFVGRAFYADDAFKHKNPDVSKNIIGFELFINWQLPVILVEGAFDAIAIKRNTIPLFGKTINDALKTQIIDNNVTDIYICLDKDARKQALETANYFMSKGIRVYFVDLKQKDPSEIGFKNIQEIIKQTEQMRESDLFAQTLFSSLASKVSGSEIII